MALLIAMAVIGGIVLLFALYILFIEIVALTIAQTTLFKEKIQNRVLAYREKHKKKEDKEVKVQPEIKTEE